MQGLTYCLPKNKGKKYSSKFLLIFGALAATSLLFLEPHLLTTFVKCCHENSGT